MTQYDPNDPRVTVGRATSYPSPDAATGGAASYAAPDGDPNDASLGSLVSSLFSDMGTLVRKEVDLAKTELTDKATTAGRNIGFLAAGGAIAYAGLLVLLAALVMGLDEWMPTGLAALIVGLVVAGLGGFLVMRGLNSLKEMNLKPTQTIESLKEDKEWAQQQVK